MEQLTPFLILLVALALSLSTISFWKTKKMMFEIDLLKNRMDDLSSEITTLQNLTRNSLEDLSVITTSLKKTLRKDTLKGGMIRYG